MGNRAFLHTEYGKAAATGCVSGLVAAGGNEKMLCKGSQDEPQTLQSPIPEKSWGAARRWGVCAPPGGI